MFKDLYTEAATSVDNSPTIWSKKENLRNTSENLGKHRGLKKV